MWFGFIVNFMMKIIEDMIAFCMGMVCAFALMGFCLGGKLVSKDDAVKEGKAEYYLDGKNERQWRWK